MVSIRYEVRSFDKFFFQVVFSIDGSFAASVSVTGKDPKVKPGAVDIVRHWQELGYLLVYVTGRPDMQLQRVVAWLTQHNFPKGLVSFADGFTTDPLKYVQSQPIQDFFLDFQYQGGVESTVSGVFEDLKFKISEGQDQLRQPTGQRQENFNFGPSLLKF